MLNLKAGDIVDVSHWDGLTVLRVDSKLGDYIKVDVSALGDGVPDYFSVKEIDGWTDGEYTAYREGVYWKFESGDPMHIVGVTKASSIIEAIDKFNSGDVNY